MRLRVLAFALLATGCAVEMADDALELDLEPFDAGDGKADGVLAPFVAERIISEAAFTDGDAVSADEVQRFFEHTPYGRPTFLANERIGSLRASDALVAAARQHGINPIVLLATLQKEKSLIGAASRPSDPNRVDFAFGCGCPDGRACIESFRGLDRQLACAAEKLRSYYDALTERRATAGGQRLNVPFRTSDGTTITPVNRATIALYTYTPWILEGRGGNWLFWNVYRRYAVALGYQEGLTHPFNEGFIGGACETSADCLYDGGLCESGRCTMPCDRFCPDRDPNFAVTFCVDAEGQGRCVAQCDASLITSGCPDAQQCVAASRFNDPSATREVCR